MTPIKTKKIKNLQNHNANNSDNYLKFYIIFFIYASGIKNKGSLKRSE